MGAITGLEKVGGEKMWATFLTSPKAANSKVGARQTTKRGDFTGPSVARDCADSV